MTTEEPPRLGSVNPEVPRDLETIVHKAIDRDPAHRYATAGELAADLQRFLDDEPIQARAAAFCDAARWLGESGHCRAGGHLDGACGRPIGWAADRGRRGSATRRPPRKAGSMRRRARPSGRPQGGRSRAGATRLIAETYRASLSEVRALRLARPPGWRTMLSGRSAGWRPWRP